MGDNGAFDVLRHPLNSATCDEVIYHDHVPTDNGTAGYADVRKFLGRLRELIVSKLSIPLAIVVGDQQSFSRMVWLKRKEPSSYSFVIPFYGDFHFAVHLLMAVHTLWWGPLICCLLDESGFCVQSIHQEWSSVELYNRHRFVYETIIVGIFTYLIEVLPTGALKHPDILLEAARTKNSGKSLSQMHGNFLVLLDIALPMLYRALLLGLEVLLRFLFDFGFPWLFFRQSIRRGDSEAMDEMHRIAVLWFRATNKHQYARICIDYIFLLLNLHPALKRLWSKYRTCSKVGNSGRNIAWDQRNEFMNLDVKEMHPDSPSRIDKVITMLGGLETADAHIREAVGQVRGKPDEYTSVKARHVQLILDVLKSKLGSTSDALFPHSPVNFNPFGNTSKPWVKVKNPSGTQTHDIFSEAMRWATGQLERAPFPDDSA